MKTKEIKTAVFYGRVSTEEQARHGYGLDAQQADCKKWAELNGYQIVEYFIDAGKTGTNMDRQGMRNLLSYIKKHSVSTVITWKLDRLSRNMKDFYGKIWTVLSDHNTTIASYTERFDDINEIDAVLIGVYIGQA